MGTRTLVGTTRVNIGLTYSDAIDLSTTQAAISQEVAQSWTSGTGSNQANREYDDTLALAAATQSLDLYGGLTDRFGNTLNFVDIREIIIVNKSTVSGETLEISGNFVTGVLWADWVDDAAKITIGPTGIYHVKNAIDGYTVTNDSADTITLDPAANTFNVDVYILGTE